MKQRNGEIGDLLIKKELEFYKSNYDKEIKIIFSGWFDLLQNTMIASNEKVEKSTQYRYQKELEK